MKIWRNKGSRKNAHIVGIFILLGLFILIIVLPEELFNNKTICLHKKLTGFGCPLCGMVHAVYLFGRFQFRQALIFNYNVLFLPVILITEIIYIFRNTKLIARFRKTVFILFIAGLLFLYLVRIYKFISG